MNPAFAEVLCAVVPVGTTITLLVVPIAEVFARFLDFAIC